MPKIGSNTLSVAYLPPEKTEEFLKTLEQSSLKEVDVMISNLAKNIRDGMKKARREGYELGFKIGFEIGYEIGFEIGIEKTGEQEQYEVTLEIAEKMLRNNFPIDVITESTGLPLIEVIQLYNKTCLECKNPFSFNH